MSASPARHLHVVDADSGEVLPDGCPACKVKDDEIAGLQRDLRGWMARFADLKRDKEAEARADPLWADGARLFRIYCCLTGQPGKPRKLHWTAERFELVRPFLKKHGVAMCERAIVGRVFEHFTSRRRNGSTVHFCEWERIFGAMGQGSAASNFEESCNRAPRDWRDRLPGERAA